jgi:hypothetical protein
MEEPVAGDMMGDEPFMELYQQVKPYTMTSPERLYALHKAVLYTIEKNLPGVFCRMRRVAGRQQHDDCPYIETTGCTKQAPVPL